MVSIWPVHGFVLTVIYVLNGFRIRKSPSNESRRITCSPDRWFREWPKCLFVCITITQTRKKLCLYYKWRLQCMSMIFHEKLGDRNIRKKIICIILISRKVEGSVGCNSSLDASVSLGIILILLPIISKMHFP